MRYAIVGAGSRHAMFREALAEHPIAAGLELVALCDVNRRGSGSRRASRRERPGNGVATYHAGEFGR